MKKRTKIILAVIAAISLLIVGVEVVFPRVMGGRNSHERGANRIRVHDAQTIARLVLEFIEKQGHVPLAEKITDTQKAALVLIGHSQQEEEAFARVKPFDRDVLHIGSASLEQELTKGLGRVITLPRDPDPVASFAPNVYVYFATTNQISVISHLSSPSSRSVPYTWDGHTYHAHTLVYGNRD